MSDLERLGRTIKRVQDQDHRALDAALREVGITLVQWDAVRAIGRAPGSTAHDLAIASFQSDQAFGTLANRLEAAGWIERRPGLGRRIEHHLTDAGRAKLAEGRSRAERVWPALFGALDGSERAMLQALLDKLLPGEADGADGAQAPGDR
jgi:DNA-binding MarR family transcriptional regulator